MKIWPIGDNKQHFFPKSELFFLSSKKGKEDLPPSASCAPVNKDFCEPSLLCFDLLLLIWLAENFTSATKAALQKKLSGKCIFVHSTYNHVNPFSANFTKWSNTLNNSSAIYVFIRIVLVMVRFMTSGLDIEGYMLEVNMVEGCMVEVNS